MHKKKRAKDIKTFFLHFRYVLYTWQSKINNVPYSVFYVKENTVPHILSKKKYNILWKIWVMAQNFEKHFLFSTFL